MAEREEQLVAKPSADAVIDALLERHGQTYAEELGIDVAKGTPSVLFRLLVASILFSARIGAGQAVKAARVLTEEGWRTAEKLAATSWRERVRVLNRHGYARYDERTTSMLDQVHRVLAARRRHARPPPADLAAGHASLHCRWGA